MPAADTCPHCGSKLVAFILRTRLRGLLLYRCGECHQLFTMRDTDKKDVSRSS